jgi:phage terminase small subunit
MPTGGKRPGAGRSSTQTTLTAKQARFVAEYLIDLNATQAAIRAGYSRKTAEQQGYENLRKPEIAQALTAGKAQQLDTAELSAARVLEELRRLALVDARSFWDAQGRLKPLSELTVDQGAALAGFEVIIKNAKAGDGQTDEIHKIKLWDKTRALELLAKHFKLLTEVHEHRVSLEDLVASSMPGQD